MEKTRTFRIPNDLDRASVEKAAREDITLSQAIRRLLRRWVLGEIEAIPPEGEEATGQGEAEMGD